MSATLGPDISQTMNAPIAAYKPKAKVSIKLCEMSKEMCEEAVRIADDAFSSHLTEVDLAERLKKSFDAMDEGPWHCAVGRHFESALTHRRGYFLHFNIGCLSVILIGIWFWSTSLMHPIFLFLSCD
uniref:Dynein light chain n=1 Tax=Parascaris univalens TaxID=6257 RepID=A0A914ZT43_PARUN